MNENYTYQISDSLDSETVGVKCPESVCDSDDHIYLIPGYLTGPEHYDQLTELLRDDGHKLHRINIKGQPTEIIAEFDQVEESSFSRAWASAAYTAIERHEAEKPSQNNLTVIGYSMGGAAATLACTKLPGVRHLILIAPVGAPNMIERLLLHPFRVRFLRPFVILILTPIALMQSGITQVQKKFLSYKNTDAHNQYDRTRSYSKIKKSGNNTCNRIT